MAQIAPKNCFYLGTYFLKLTKIDQIWSNLPKNQIFEDFGQFHVHNSRTHHFLQELDFRTLSSSCKHTAVFSSSFGLCRHREAETHSRSWYLVCMWAYASLTSSNREGVLTTNHRKPLIQKDSKAEQRVGSHYAPETLKMWS